MYLPGRFTPGGDLRLALHFTDLETEAEEREVTSSWPHGLLVVDSVRLCTDPVVPGEWRRGSLRSEVSVLTV